MITCSSPSKKGIVSDVENAIEAGCKVIQYREKKKNTREMINEAKKLIEICKGKAIFLVNDRIDLALAVNADGVHLGQDDIPVNIARIILGNEKIIGLTVHNIDEAILAQKQGVDYIGIAPIFNTYTKKDSKTPCGINMIKKIKNSVDLPIIAVGGINQNNVTDVIFSGADGVAAVSAVLDSSDVYDCVKNFINKIKEVKIK
jgi:thiamine-phosphate pyrophosphorylase